VKDYLCWWLKTAKEHRMSKKTYHHLTHEERWQIKALKESGKSMRAIARQLGRSPNTISKELTRGALPRGGYSARRAQRTYQRLRAHHGKKRRMLRGDRLTYVRRCLHRTWSPEQIAGRMKLLGMRSVSYSTIYRTIHRTKHHRGLLKCLRHGGKKYTRGKAGKHLIPHRIDISERPAIVEKKQRIGDWEADTIIGARHQGCIISLVDRASKYTKLSTAPNKEAEHVAQRIITALRPLPNQHHTITYDNGKEFARHQHINTQLGCSSYFATPYHSWERGLNEHTNGLVRQFFPKGISLRNSCCKKLQSVENLLNNRPRKVLNYKTPAEVYFNIQPSRFT
jgi:IS30 family transposase